MDELLNKNLKEKEGWNKKKRSLKSYTYSLARIASVPKRNISNFRASKTRFGSWDALCPAFFCFFSHPALS